MKIGISRRSRAQSSSGYLNCISGIDFPKVINSKFNVQGSMSKVP
jgi:hypothetical protein